MKRLAWVLALPLALAAALPSDELAFAPAANSSVAKELKVDVELTMEDVSFTVNGEDVPPEALGPITNQKVLAHLLIGVTEKYVESKEGRPIDLLRTFDDLSMKAEIGGNTEDATDEAKAFEGRTVRFRWNEDKKEYDKSWHESTESEDKLEGLLADMDLRVLLPTKKVSEGDSWDIAAEELGALFMPGGIPGGGSEGDTEGMAAIEEDLRGQLEGFVKDFKVHCKYGGTREDGGAHVAEIRFTFEGTPKIDLGPIIQRVVSEQKGPDADIAASITADLKGEGTLLWDQKASHAHAFDMSSQIGLTADMEAQAEEQGQSFRVVVSARAGGKATWEMRAKKP